VDKKKYKYICAVIFGFLYLSAMPGLCLSGPPFKTAIVVSKKIRPYIHVADGIARGVKDTLGRTDVFFISNQESRILTKLSNDPYDLVAAIGPEAAVFVWENNLPSKKMYVAVLDPESLSELGPGACGISLRIPVAVQVETIAQNFNAIEKIGLIFDPRHNQWFFEQAFSAASNFGIEIVAMPVNSKNQITGLLKEQRGKIEAIWMIPDPTVISEKIIHYVIKQGIYNNMGVIGYNSFFTRSGAFFSFEFDYESLGLQAGEQIGSYLQTGQCGKDTPVFKTIINRKIADKIGIRVKE